MKRSLIVLMLALCTLCCSCSSVWPLQGRALSLKVLQAQLRAGKSAQISDMCGITRITGYVVDQKRRDIILLGVVDPCYPSLHLDDFVVALRNINLNYATRSGDTYYYTPPGCSIDPDPKTLANLQISGQKLASTSGIDAKRKVIEEWGKIATGDQTVRVLGVPYDTGFAKVMVDADYDMKRVANGSVDLGLDGFKNLMDNSVEAGKTVGLTPMHSMSRFWFYPGDFTYALEDGVVVLKTCQVKLLTEEEFLTEQGQLEGSGKGNPLAMKFAQAFTSRYDEIAAARPIYKELQGLFRFTAVGNMINDDPAARGVDLGYLLKSYAVHKVPVYRKVTGLSRVKEIVETKDTQSGSITTVCWSMLCGGVDMNVRPRKVAATKSHQSTKLKTKVLTARKSPDTLCWDFTTD